MEEKRNGGYEHHEERRDYAGNENRNGYSAEGRKLRPRRKISPAASSNQDGEYRPYNSRKTYSNDHRGGYQNRDSRYGQSGERRSFKSRDNREDGERRSYGENRPSYGEGRPGGYGQQRRSYSNSSYGNNSHGNNSHGNNSHGNSSYNRRDNREDGERRSYGEGRPGGYGQQRRQGGYNTRKGPARPAAPRKPMRKNAPHFSEADESGINQMISRKPQVDNPAYSDNDMVATPIKEEIRLNKFIANSGVCSRREADNLIQAGVVTVNGEVVTELGTKVNVLKDDIRFNGERLKGEEKVYIVMNKPKGFVTSASDPHAEKTVMDLLKGCKMRVFPVGRLDKNTTGVLMFTNDGEIAEQLTHPSYNKKKIYQVILDKALDEADKEKILVEGLELNDGVIKADELEYIDAEDHRRLGIEIHSGKNRIVRRIFESLGYTVKALDRVYFAGLTKKGLKKGEWRYLSTGEVNVLKMGAYV